MKNSFIALTLALIATSTSNAAIARFTTGAGSLDTITNTSGSPIPNVDVLMGYYNSAPTGSDPVADFANFVLLQGFNGANASGQYTGTGLQNTTFDNNLVFQGKTVYVWIFEGSYDGALGEYTDPSLGLTKGTFASGGQYGLFNYTRLWGNVSPSTDTLFSLADTNGIVATYGSYEDPVGGATNNSVNFELVPEPSSAALGLIAAAGLIARRRRA